MLAGVRSCFVSILLTFSVAFTFPAHAQINGVPPSVTSLGFGGRFLNGVPASVTSFNGVPPGVTSMGHNGYADSWSPFTNCCANFYFPSPSSFNSSGHHHHHKKDAAGEVIEPVYVPYGVPYALADAQEDDDVTTDASAGNAAGGPNPNASMKRSIDRGSTAQPLDSDPPPDPVAVQPSTVLVFKDGHKSDVVNYAIVGDTLFDFENGRTRKILLADLDLPATHKANDDRGIDFQLPAATKGH
jgi:hypothetical protein